MGLGDGTGVLQDLAELDQLGDQLGQNYAGARLDDLDLDALARQLGQDAAVTARMLSELEKALREGVCSARTPRSQVVAAGVRRLGKALLADAAKTLSGRQGNRDTRQAGAAGELRLVRPVRGHSATPNRGTSPARLTNDHPYRERGRRPGGRGQHGRPRRGGERDRGPHKPPSGAAGGHVLLDGRRGPLGADEKTALALHHLVSTRFRGDQLQVISFGRWAQSREISELTGLRVREQGTNLHHGLLLASRFFRKHPSMQPVLLVVTDGEPATLTLTSGGDAYFYWPPDPETIALTVVELDKLARTGVNPIFFRLGDDPGLARFLDQLARRSDGRVVTYLTWATWAAPWWESSSARGSAAAGTPTTGSSRAAGRAQSRPESVETRARRDAGSGRKLGGGSRLPLPPADRHVARVGNRPQTRARARDIR